MTIFAGVVLHDINAHAIENLNDSPMF